MNKERMKQLETEEDAELTQEEIQEGWHFCPDWDGMLIGTGMPEMDGCSRGDLELMRSALRAN